MADNSRRRFRYARRPVAERMKDFKERKPRGPLVAGRSLNPRQQKELRRANHLLSIGDHANAAILFEDMAGRAHDRSILYPAAMLLMQAAHAHLMAEAAEASLVAARRGFELLASQERWHTLQHEGQRYLGELRAAQHAEPAEQLAAWIAATLPATLPAAQPTSDTCPYCGAHGSLEALAAGRASSCRYCGSVVLL
ncbi:MAG TPA: hypothetical protein PLC52_08815 [Anaerolineales bacterium]|nr:hypothetical protein [Anaerolineales bacterium]HRQ92951.1 hypothetical protein [Anaerolineales bacterium]